MACKKVKGGWKIKTEKGSFFPKLYKTLASCKKRVAELERHK